MQNTDYNIPVFENNDVADLNEYSNRMKNALKTQLDKFGNPLTYKGEVDSLENLPANPVKGDIYSVAEELENYVWNGENWVVYSATLDLSSLKEHKYTLSIAQTITSGTNITLPCYYKVGSDVLDVLYCGCEHLTKGTHYNEVGNTGDISNTISLLFDIGDLSDYSEYLVLIVKGEYINE